jgi:hypothetical protein
MKNKKIIFWLALVFLAIILWAVFVLNNKTNERGDMSEKQVVLEGDKKEYSSNSVSQGDFGFHLDPDGKRVKGNGIEIYFEDGVEGISENDTVTFNPKNKKTFEEKEGVAGPPDYYNFWASDFQTADDVINEESQSELNVKKPIKKKVNNLEVVEFSEGGYCENRYAVVVGEKYNYYFSSMGCYHDEATDFASFEKAIKTMKFNEVKNYSDNTLTTEKINDGNKALDACRIINDEPVPYNVGDKIGVFTVISISSIVDKENCSPSENNYEMKTSGETEISGTFKYLEPDSWMGYVYFKVDEEFYDRLSNNSEEKTKVFSISNYNSETKKIEDFGQTGWAKIVIKDYISRNCDCHAGYDSAELVSVMEIKEKK